ncbi:MAG: hypothetical protein CSA26_12135 [Desulfobacterales bacterium]|nr:MAG: hypothetical protein CSA26_12135 [Desulfobacterales bacterium]
MDCKGLGSWRSALSPSLELWPETLKRGTCYRAGRDCIPERVDSCERPEEVGCRIGDWEGDTVKGGLICFVTLPERFSRLFFCTRIERKTAGPVSAAIVEMLRKVKGKLRTLICDNGGEFAEHSKRTEAMGVPVSFVRPCSSSGNGEPTKTAMDACERCGPKSSIYQHVQQEKLRTASPTPGKVRKGLTSWDVFTGKRVARIT